MATRRSFIAGMLATGVVAKPTWANAGSPDYLSAARTSDGRFVLCGLRIDGSIAFQLPLPARGHAAAAHPKYPEAVAFARRPGTYAVVLDCTNGRLKARLEAPTGRHFYGHGTYSKDGDLLFTSENEFEAARGRVGVWDVRKDYARVGEFSSGGIGPHDVKLKPDGQTLVVANGGIETHPATGRTKLNLPTMRSNLSFLQLDGALIERVELGAQHQRNSIRHLAVSGEGVVAFAMQWQGDIGENLPLLGTYRRDTGSTELFEEASVRKMQGYLGSIAIGARANQVAVTSPRSGVVQVFGPAGLLEAPLVDVCGIAIAGHDFIVTTGEGLVRTPADGDIRYDLAWDNHLVAI